MKKIIRVLLTLILVLNIVCCVEGKVEAKDIVYKTSDSKLNKESREYLDKKENLWISEVFYIAVLFTASW